MARKPENYWEKRNTELMKSIEKSTEDTITSLIIVYNKAAEEINKEIKKIFNRYADNGNLTEDEAIKLLSKIEKDEVYDELLNKINTLDNKKAVASILNKYNAAAYSYRISRYEAMLDKIELELRKLGELENKITRIRYVDTINEAYYHTIFNVQKELGYSFSFSEIDRKTLNLMLNNNWNNNANYSSRIWGNVQALNDYLKTNLVVSNITGKSVHKIASELNSAMNVGLYNATRLVRTETNYFANQSELMAYEECGIEEYQFIATLDKITCKHCAELDKKVFKVKEAKPGKNCPPVHPMDRCTTVAKLDDEYIEDMQRRAKDESEKNILVPKEINYKDWKNGYILNADKPYVEMTSSIMLNCPRNYNVTEQQYFMDDDGNKYYIDGKRVKIQANIHERKVAELLGKIYGGKINLIPTVSFPQKLMTPDYTINGLKYDLKTLNNNNSNTIYNVIHAKKKQAHNFIIDISNNGMTENEAISQIESIYYSIHTKWVDSLVLIKDYKVLKIYYKK